MEKREIEKMLYEYPFLKAENKNIMLEIERMDINGIKPISYEFKPKVNSNGSVVESEVIDLDKKRKALEGKKRLNEIHLEKIDTALQSLSELQREVIKRIYFKKFRSKDIAQQLFITHIYVSMLKRKALAKLEVVLK